jgi:integrase
MIYERNGGFGVAVYDPATKRMRWISTFPSREEAEAAETEAARRIRNPGLGYASRWLIERPRPADSTRENYARAVARFVERFGDGPLDALSVDELRVWATSQQPSIAQVVQTMYSDAIRDGAHPGPNPLGHFFPYRPGRRRPGQLSEDDAHRLAECAVDAWGEYGLETLAPAILTTAYAHLTRAELFNLRPGDISGDVLSVQQGLRTDDHRLPAELSEQLRRRASSGNADWMFEMIRGGKFTEGTFYRYWSVVRVAYGRPDMQFHQVRIDHQL